MTRRNKHLLPIILLAAALSSCTATPTQTKADLKSPERIGYGVGGFFGQGNNKNTFRYNVVGRDFSGYFEINNHLPEKHTYTLITLVNMKQRAYMINGEKARARRFSMRAMEKRRYKFIVPDIPKGINSVVTILFQDLDKARQIEKTTIYNNVYYKAIITSGALKNRTFFPKIMKEYPNERLDVVAFYKKGIAYYPDSLTVVHGKSFRLRLVVASAYQKHDFALMVFINGHQKRLGSESHIAGVVNRKAKIFVEVPLLAPIRKGRYRLDILSLSSPFEKEDALSQFTDSIRLNVL